MLEEITYLLFKANGSRRDLRAQLFRAVGVQGRGYACFLDFISAFFGPRPKL